MSDKRVVLAVFDDEATADAAAESLKETGIAAGDAIGVLVVGPDGTLKTDKLGARSWGAGAGIGFLLFLLGPALLGIGVIGGTLLGGLHHKSLKMADPEKEALAADLAAGKAAVGVLAHPDDAAAIEAFLAERGGDVRTLAVAQADLDEDAALVEAAEKVAAEKAAGLPE